MTTMFFSFQYSYGILLPFHIHSREASKITETTNWHLDCYSASSLAAKYPSYSSMISPYPTISSQLSSASPCFTYYIKLQLNLCSIVLGFIPYFVILILKNFIVLLVIRINRRITVKNVHIYKSSIHSIALSPIISK